MTSNFLRYGVRCFCLRAFLSEYNSLQIVRCSGICLNLANLRAILYCSFSSFPFNLGAVQSIMAAKLGIILALCCLHCGRFKFL